MTKFVSDRTSSNMAGVTLMNNQVGYVVAGVMRGKDGVRVLFQPQNQGKREIAWDVWFRWRSGCTRNINQPDIVGFESSRDTGFLELFEQSFVKLAVGIDIPL